ncbi:hypothetical protein EBB79_14920 [Parasedimentitalea marina]|uniref:Uncharacterized protein n=1 Tax=Parasedimentitalea marina TaxID=2483033 RepID=A0A3T0N4S0_9RHOB|nr:hypothetical protein EBB79_14920 [Parasedimentitalea marina]
MQDNSAGLDPKDAQVVALKRGSIPVQKDCLRIFHRSRYTLFRDFLIFLSAPRSSMPPTRQLQQKQRNSKTIYFRYLREAVKYFDMRSTKTRYRINMSIKENNLSITNH